MCIRDRPIVENAFKHGICPKEEGGVVRIRVNPLREKGLLLSLIHI